MTSPRGGLGREAVGWGGGQPFTQPTNGKGEGHPWTLPNPLSRVNSNPRSNFAPFFQSGLLPTWCVLVAVAMISFFSGEKIENSNPRTLTLGGGGGMSDEESSSHVVFLVSIFLTVGGARS